MKKIIILMSMFIILFSLSETVFAEKDIGYKKAFHYYYTGRYKEAIRLFRDYLKEKPDSSIYYYIGYALYKIRKFDEANKYFKIAYDIDPMFSPQQNISIQENKKMQRKIR